MGKILPHFFIKKIKNAFNIASNYDRISSLKLDVGFTVPWTD